MPRARPTSPRRRRSPGPVTARRLRPAWSRRSWPELRFHWAPARRPGREGALGGARAPGRGSVRYEPPPSGPGATPPPRRRRAPPVEPVPPRPDRTRAGPPAPPAGRARRWPPPPPRSCWRRPLRRLSEPCRSAGRRQCRRPRPGRPLASGPGAVMSRRGHRPGNPPWPPGRPGGRQ